MLIDHHLTSPKAICSSSDECSSSDDSSSSSDSSIESSSSDSDNPSSSNQVPAKKVNAPKSLPKRKIQPKRKINLSQPSRHNIAPPKLQSKLNISSSDKVPPKLSKPKTPLRSKSTTDYIAVKDIKRKRLRSKYQQWCDSRSNQSSNNKISVKPTFRQSIKNYPPIPGIIINKRSLFTMRTKKHSNHPTTRMKELSKKESVNSSICKKRKRKKIDSYNISHKTDQIPKQHKKKKLPVAIVDMSGETIKVTNVIAPDDETQKSKKSIPSPTLRLQKLSNSLQGIHNETDDTSHKSYSIPNTVVTTSIAEDTSTSKKSLTLSSIENSSCCKSPESNLYISGNRLELDLKTSSDRDIKRTIKNLVTTLQNRQHHDTSLNHTDPCVVRQYDLCMYEPPNSKCRRSWLRLNLKKFCNKSRSSEAGILLKKVLQWVDGCILERNIPSLPTIVDTMEILGINLKPEGRKDAYFLSTSLHHKFSVHLQNCIKYAIETSSDMDSHPRQKFVERWHPPPHWQPPTDWETPLSWQITNCVEESNTIDTNESTSLADESNCVEKKVPQMDCNLTTYEDATKLATKSPISASKNDIISDVSMTNSKSMKINEPVKNVCTKKTIEEVQNDNPDDSLRILTSKKILNENQSNKDCTASSLESKMFTEDSKLNFNSDDSSLLGQINVDETILNIQETNFTLDNIEDSTYSKELENHMTSCVEFSKLFNWSDVLKNQLCSHQVPPEFIQVLPKCYHTSKIPSLIKQNEVNDILMNLSRSQKIFFDNLQNEPRKNVITELENAASFSNDNEEIHDTDNSFDGELSKYTTFENPQPTLILSLEEIFKFLYHMSIYSMFDFGFQINDYNTQLWDTEKTTFLDKVFSTKSNKTVTKDQLVEQIREEPGDIFALNHCPLCPTNDEFCEQHKIDSIIRKQRSSIDNVNETINVYKPCFQKKYKNKDLYQHLYQKKEHCCLHHLLYKYIKEKFPKISWSIENSNGSKSRQNKCKKLNNQLSTSPNVSMTTYSLTR